MLLKNKSENSQVIYNFIGTALRSGIMFLTMPVFTRLLGSEQFGKYSVYASWLNIFVCFMGCGVYSALGTGLHHYGSAYPKFRKNILWEGTLIGLFVCAMFLIFSPALSAALGFSVFILAVMIAEAFAQFILNFADSAWVYEKKASSNMVLSVSVLLTTTLLSIALLLGFGDRITDLYYARAIGTALPQIVIAAGIWIYFWKQQKLEYNKEYWKYGLHFGIPIVFHLLSQQILVQSDRIMMRQFSVPDSEIGIYSFFYTFTSILSAVLAALNKAWCPILYDLLDKNETQKLEKKIKRYITLFSLLICGFLLVSNEVTEIFSSEEYWPGKPLIPLLVMVVFFTFAYQFAVNYEFYHKKPQIVAVGTFAAALVNIVLNFIFIPNYGIYGAAAATLISYMTLAAVHVIVVKSWRNEKYPLRLAPIFKSMAAVLGMCFLSYFLTGYRIIRWCLAALLGIALIAGIKKRKSIF